MFAPAIKARLTLLHVVEPWTICEAGERPELEAILATYAHDYEDEARRTLDKMVQRGCDTGVVCHGLVVTGVPLQMILAVARARQVDCIIMGTHGRSGVSRVLLGSVAAGMMRYAPCPVLVVRAQEPALRQECTTSGAAADHPAGERAESVTA